MKIRLLAVFDIQAQVYMQPMFVQSDGVGIRMVSDEVNRAAQDNVMYQHPEDFRLFRLGDWDNESGSFHARAQPELLCDCVTLKR